MRHEPFTAFHQALRLGPGYCPPDLFDGSVAAIVRGLKVHANNIAHARHVALEETYPRLLSHMGLGRFHQAAERFLTDPVALGRALDQLGEGFEAILDDPAERDLARAEWLWLETFNAAETQAVTLAELALLTPEALLAAEFRLHSATRWLALEQPASFNWDDAFDQDGDTVLLTRPDSTVTVRRISGEAATLLPSLIKSRPAGEMLEADPSALITLVGAGAILLEKSDEA